MSVKICRKCGEEKDRETGFYFNEVYPDDYEATCKACRNKRRSWRNRNPYTGITQEIVESELSRLLRCWRPVRDDSL